MRTSNRGSLLAAAAMLGLSGIGGGYAGPSRSAYTPRGSEAGWTPSKRVGSKRRRQKDRTTGGQGGKRK